MNILDSWTLREAALDAGEAFFASLAANAITGPIDPVKVLATAGIMAGLSFFRHARGVNGKSSPPETPPAGG